MLPLEHASSGGGNEDELAYGSATFFFLTLNAPSVAF